MMKKIRSLMAIAIAMTTFVACSDSDDDNKYVADVNVPTNVPTTSEGYLLLEAGAHEFTFDIKTEGKWTVTSQNRFMHVEPAEGTGNATVTVAVQNNQSDDRKEGTLIITFPGHEEQNKTLNVEQKYLGDYGGNADVLDVGNRIYAVGYSYDATETYANPDAVRLEVFDTGRLIKKGLLTTNSADIKLSDNTITGSSVNEMSNKLSVKAGVSGSYMGFKGEVKASFNTDYSQSLNHEYAITFLDLLVRRASLSKSIEALKDEYMTEDAYVDINGAPIIIRNKKRIRYPNTEEGLKSLVRDYGTHVVVKSGLGGRIRRAMDVDISDITSSYDIKAYAKASYEGVVDANVEVDENYKEAFKENKSSITINSHVLGGDENLAKTLSTQSGFTKSNLLSWMHSVTADKMALVSFEEKSLVPLYELVDRNATVEEDGFDGNLRYNALKQYLDGGMAYDDEYSTYNCGTVVEIDVPKFDNKWNTTLVKDVYCDGHWFAQICNEYIPAINRDERITVIYPVIANRIRYNMGFFLGSDALKPARVSWTSKGVCIEEHSDLDFGKVSKLYLRGSSISPILYDGLEAKTGTARDEYLDAIRGTSTGTYPIVKIFNMMWARESYKYMSKTNSSRDVTVMLDGNPVTIKNVCVPLSVAKDPQNYPSGWQVASWDEFKSMLETLKANGHTMPVIAMRNGGQTGFELVFEGGWSNYNNDPWYTYPQCYGTRDGCGFLIYSDNRYDMYDYWSATERDRDPVRVNKVLIK